MPIWFKRSSGAVIVPPAATGIFYVLYSDGAIFQVTHLATSGSLATNQSSDSSKIFLTAPSEVIVAALYAPAGVAYNMEQSVDSAATFATKFTGSANYDNVAYDAMNLKQDSSAPNLIWASTEDQSLANGNSRAIVSTDGGVTWTDYLVEGPLANHGFGGLFGVSRNNGADFFLSQSVHEYPSGSDHYTRFHLIDTSGAVTTWAFENQTADYNNGNDGFFEYGAVIPGAPDLIYLATGFAFPLKSSIYTFQPSTGTLTKIQNNILSTSNFTSQMIATHLGTLLALETDFSTFTYVHRSTDGWATWTTSPLLATSGLAYVAENHNGVLCMPCPDGAAWFSLDDGVTWQHSDVFLDLAQIRAVWGAGA